VPTFSPVDVGVFRSSEDPSIVTVTWQPLTLVEARGFIEYVVRLYLEESELAEQQVPMNSSTVMFRSLDSTSRYEASVGTRSLSSNATGPGMHSYVG
jgi:hypothetical protein